MQDDSTTTDDTEPTAEAPVTSKPRRRRSVSRAAGPPSADAAEQPSPEPTLGDTAPTPTDSPAPPAVAAPPKKRASRTRKAVAGADADHVTGTSAESAAPAGPESLDPAEPPVAEAPAERPTRQPRKRTSRARTTPPVPVSADTGTDAETVADPVAAATPEAGTTAAEGTAATDTADAGDATDASTAPADKPSLASALLFQAPAFVEPTVAEPVQRPEPTGRVEVAEPPVTDVDDETSEEGDDLDDDAGAPRRRRRRGGRGRRRRDDDLAVDEAGADEVAVEAPADADQDTEAAPTETQTDESDEAEADGDASTRRRRRRRRRKGETESEAPHPDDPPNTVVRVRETRESDDEVTSVKGSTRLEAKKQRRREGREAGRRRPPILTEAEFLARREAVNRVMAVRQSGDLTQIAVLEDDVLVEHYVSRASQQSLIGNVYLGRVQNVLPSMEAAFVDIGRGRNAVLYAGEVDWSARAKNDGPKRIEDVLKSGQSVLVQVTKDPIGHKGARLTSQISLPGRYVVYVPGGSMSGISRKLPDTERTRLKKILKQVVPEEAGVIVRTAAEGATEEELTNDVMRLQKQWEAIEKKTSGSAPALLHGEPDLAIKVVRDLFNEDFGKLVVSGDAAWDTIDEYVTSVAGTLRERVERWTGPSDLFAEYRIDEQIAKALDRKVWLPSGGSLVIDRTEAMTVVDVNTGKFTGSGGNLEETVTKNNLEAAEEIVRQLRLRDIGGIIVVDFIDMVLEANRELVLRRLIECLGRDRTKHQVAEVTSLGLVQMTRKRIGTGLLEAFSEPCPHCKGRGLLFHTHPVDESRAAADEHGSGRDHTDRSERRGRRRRGEPAEKHAEVTVAPKLEAVATPGQASPADLIPVAAVEPVRSDADTGEATGHGSAPEAPLAAPTQEAPPPAPAPEGPADAPAVTAPEVVEEEAVGKKDVAEGAVGEEAPAAEPAQPPRRGRRRAQRPAGSPNPTTSV
jgi:ribonuclease E